MILNAIFIGLMSALIVGSGVLMLSVIGEMIKNAAERGEKNREENERLNLKDYSTNSELLVSFLKAFGTVLFAGLLVYVIAADFLNVYESLSAAIFVIVILTIPLCIGASNAYSRLKLQKMLKDRKKAK